MRTFCAYIRLALLTPVSPIVFKGKVHSRLRVQFAQVVSLLLALHLGQVNE